MNALCVSQSMTVDEANEQVARIKRQKKESETKLHALREQPVEGDSLRRMAQVLREAAQDRRLTEAVDAGMVDCRNEVENLITRVWIEDDGSLTVEGAVLDKHSPPSRSMGQPHSW